MASYGTTRFHSDVLKAVHDLTSITAKVMAVNAQFFTDFNTAALIQNLQFVSDIKSPTDYELSGTGYSRQTLTTKTVTRDTTVHRAVFDADDSVFTGINAGTIAGLWVLRDRGGADSANELLFLIDNADLITNSANVTVQWAATGIYRW